MTMQLGLDFNAPPLAQARAAGREGARRAEAAAERITPSVTKESAPA